tara:strand:- start:95 stop:337 length:243 start_codon:yes stop_codon:yes gene_type:complete
MITWIVYIVVFFILLFVLYLGIIGAKIGLKAKNSNKVIKIKYNNKSSKYVSAELKKIKNLYNDGLIDKKEFSAAKKKLLS